MCPKFIDIKRRKDWSYSESLILLDIIASHWGILNNKKTNSEKAKVWQKMFTILSNDVKGVR